MHARFHGGHEESESLSRTKWDTADGKISASGMLNDIAQRIWIVDVGSALAAHDIALAGLEWIADTMPSGHGDAIGDQECGVARGNWSSTGFVDDGDGQNIVRGLEPTAHSVTPSVRAHNVLNQPPGRCWPVG
jgi:hypothetical protein